MSITILTNNAMGDTITALYKRIEELSDNTDSPTNVGFNSYDEVLNEIVNIEEKIYFLRQEAEGSVIR